MFLNICRITKKNPHRFQPRITFKFIMVVIAKIAKVAEKNKKFMSSRTDVLGLIVEII